jgi:hypothetical protein
VLWRERERERERVMERAMPSYIISYSAISTAYKIPPYAMQHVQYRKVAWQFTYIHTHTHTHTHTHV